MNLNDQYSQMHAEGHFKGYSLLPHVEDIAAIVKRYNAKTLLDYGCGKGLQYTEAKAHEAWGGIMPTLYDPHVEKFSVKPVGNFDLVICTDVLEHVPEEEIEGVLKAIGLMRAANTFLVICTRPAKKNLPDGRNCHLTVKNKEWWMLKIMSFEYGGFETGRGEIYSHLVMAEDGWPRRWHVKFVE